MIIGARPISHGAPALRDRHFGPNAPHYIDLASRRFRPYHGQNLAAGRQ
jgi:hypothetical protein